jgi:hypothetical protein
MAGIETLDSINRKEIIRHIYGYLILIDSILPES